MADSAIGVAVIGAGMAGRAHAAGYRRRHPVRHRAAAGSAGRHRRRPRSRSPSTPPSGSATSARRRLGRPSPTRPTSTSSASSSPTRCTARSSRRCWPPASTSSARSRWPPPSRTPRRWSPQRARPTAGRRRLHVPAVPGDQRHPRADRRRAGRPVHFNGHYWCDYGYDPRAPMSWRYRGGPGSGALADIGSHLVDLGEYLCGPIACVRGAVLSTMVPDRPLPLGVAVGHAAGGAASEETEPVENEDIVTFTATFATGAVGTFSALPRRLRARQLRSASSCSARTARRPSTSPGRPSSPSPTLRAAGDVNGYRQVLRRAGPPVHREGLPMDFPGSATARTTSSPARLGPSSTRWPGSAGSRAVPDVRRTVCTTWGPGRGRRVGRLGGRNGHSRAQGQGERNHA